MASAVLFERHPLERTVRWRTVANELYDVGRAQMLPVLGGEVVERQQCVSILDQALDRLIVFDVPAFDEGVERREGILFGLGSIDDPAKNASLKLRTSFSVINSASH